MPVVRMCYYCKKSFLKSTYQMIKHVETCDKYLLHKQREDKFNHSQNKIVEKNIVENKNIEKREPIYTIR
jgi:hypothetical protein